MSLAARVHIESLLRARKLDITLTSAAPGGPSHDLAATGVSEMDEALGGGLRRGQLSELVGPRSSGRTMIAGRMLAAAAARGEVGAVIDTCDRFDPVSAAALGVDLSRLLWIRDTGDATRALKATNLVLQAGGFGLVIFNLAEVPAPEVRRFPHTTWMRIARAIEGSQTVAIVLAAERTARSPGGVTIALDAALGRWSGTADRARLLRGLQVQHRIVRAR